MRLGRSFPDRASATFSGRFAKRGRSGESRPFFLALLVLAVDGGESNKPGPNLPLARAKLLLVVEENSVMRLVVITGEQPVVITGEQPHHKHLCASLYAAHELVAYHPLTRAVGLLAAPAQAFTRDFRVRCGLYPGAVGREIPPTVGGMGRETDWCGLPHCGEECRSPTPRMPTTGYRNSLSDG